MKKCINCGEYNSEDANFCSGCGKAEFDTSGQIICANCKQLVKAESPYCLFCGAKLKEYAPAVQETLIKVDAVAPTNQEETLAKAVKLEELGLVPAPEAVAPVPEVKPAIYEERLTCPSCGESLRSSDVFCTRCGADVSNSNSGIVVKRKICPHCHRPNPFAAKHCSYCFTSLSEVDYEDFMITYLTDDSGKFRQAVLQSSTNKKLKVCPECGTLNELTQSQCVKCGISLIVSDEKKICFICGAENEFDAEYCNKCSYPLTGKKPTKEPQKIRCECGELNDAADVFCTNCGSQLNK